MKNIIYFVTIFLLASLANAGIRYRVTDLSEQAEGTGIIPSVGYCINNSGDVAGHGMPTAPDSNSKPFLYDANSGTFINLGNLAGNFTYGKGGNGYGINEAGQVVGRNSIANENWNYRPFLFTDANNNASVDPCEMINISIEPNFGYGWAECISNNGQVVGFSRDINDANNYYGWVWTDINANNMPEAGEKQFFFEYFPNSINDDGDIALVKDINGYLWSDLDSNGVYDVNELQLMPMPQGYVDEQFNVFVTIDKISPITINNSKAICGAAENGYGKANGFYWEDSNQNGQVDVEEYTLFGSALEYTHVRAMNNNSQVVGGTYEYEYAHNPSKSQRCAFIWSKVEGMINLNAAADVYTGSIGPRWFSQAEAISDNGIIAVSGWFDYNLDGRRTISDPAHSFVLTPYLQGDITDEGKVNFADYALLSKYYLQDSSVYPDADIDGSGFIDVNDLKILTEDWLKELNSSD